MNKPAPVTASPAPVRREREWLVPCMVMTIGLALAAIILHPNDNTDTSALFAMLPTWATYVLLIEIGYIVWHLVKMKRAGIESPLAYFRNDFDWKKPGIIGFAGLLSGFNMMCFMWIKPQINRIAPFTADPWIANLEHRLFGIDLWRLFEGFDLRLMSLTYNVLWFWALMITLFVLLFAKRSAQRSAALISYFFLWSIFGPIGQYLVPAAGPIFYERIGLGPRYAGLDASLPKVTVEIAHYLWGHYSNKTLDFGAGISAMPSLHIATSAWMVISLAAIKSRLTIPAAILGLYLLVCSVALGWHYVLDGVVGAIGAVIGYRLSLSYIRSLKRKALS